MSSDALSRSEELFHAARDLPPEQRAAFLERACGADAAQRRRVEGLLAADAAPHPLDRPTDALPVAPSALLDLVPDRVGSYRVLRRIGAGGMGIVFEAEQESPRRIVALKVLQRGSDEMLRRFEREAHVLGQLQHPGIAQVHEAGSGAVVVADQVVAHVPFLAMELVRGEPLTVCAARRGLSLRARLELFARVCDAVQAAHERGVVHRDLKPGNVLIVDAPASSASSAGYPGPALAPKILDFGVAHLLTADERASFATATGELVGTLAYMSPEQARGDSSAASVRSDVYALGVMLYELVSGQRPIELDGLSPSQAAQRIEDTDPTPLDALDPRLRGDVATIAGKALEKDPLRRYAAASEMAADLRRHLADEPILAQPPSTTYRIRKYARRNRAAVLGAFAVLLALTGGLGIGLVRARAERDEARAARSRAEKTAEFLVDVLSTSNPEDGRYDLTLREAIERFAPELSQRFAGEPLLEARLRRTLGDAYCELGRYDESRAMFQEALRLTAGVIGPEAIEALRLRLALAFVDVSAGALAEAERALRELRPVIDANGADWDRAQVHLGLADLYILTGRPALSVDEYEQAIQLRRAQFGPDSDAVITAEMGAASALAELGRYAEAEPILTRGLEHLLRTRGGDNPRTINALQVLGSIQVMQGRVDEAEDLLADATQRALQVLGPDHPTTLTSQCMLAGIWAEGGRLEQALALAESAVDAARGGGREAQPIYLDLALLVAHLRNDLLGPEAAVELLCEIAAEARERYGEESVETWLPVVTLGECYLQQGRNEEAAAVLTEAAPQIVRLLGPEHVHSTNASQVLAAARAAAGAGN